MSPTTVTTRSGAVVTFNGPDAIRDAARFCHTLAYADYRARLDEATCDSAAPAPAPGVPPCSPRCGEKVDRLAAVLDRSLDAYWLKLIGEGKVVVCCTRACVDRVAELGIGISRPNVGREDVGDALRLAQARVVELERLFVAAVAEGALLRRQRAEILRIGDARCAELDETRALLDAAANGLEEANYLIRGELSEARRERGYRPLVKKIRAVLARVDSKTSPTVGTKADGPTAPLVTGVASGYPPADASATDGPSDRGTEKSASGVTDQEPAGRRGSATPQRTEAPAQAGDGRPADGGYDCEDLTIDPLSSRVREMRLAYERGDRIVGWDWFIEKLEEQEGELARLRAGGQL